MNRLSSLVLAVVLFSQSTLAASKCVQIYYDKAEGFGFGRAIVIPLQNLIGHFPEYTRYIIPVSRYQKGDLEKCEASIYMGGYFDAALPEDFLVDFETTQKRVLWAGYNIWKMGDERLKRIWNANYSKVEGLSWAHKDEKGRPGFFKFFEYKGEIFEKYGELNPNDPKQFIAAWELVSLSTSDKNPHVISWSRHSTLHQKTPYIFQNGNHWYVADLPFTFMTEEDRYLIFSDILFDVLDAKPLYPDKAPALVRFEDLHPLINSFQLKKILDITQKVEISYGLSLIPIFSDPLGNYFPTGSPKRVALTERPDFKKMIGDHLANGASVLFHGVTHQYENLKNPFNGVSGADCEFWDCIQERPIPNESAKYFLDKLELGVSELESAGFRPAAWLTPHYMGSPLFNKLASEVFSWNIGRNTYRVAQNNLNALLKDNATFENSGVAGKSERESFLSGLTINVAADIPSVVQFFPYEIYSDINSARFIPENVGFIQPTNVGQGGKIWNVDDMLRVLKRNRVLRDVWGSLFIHPFMFNTVPDGGLAKFPGDTSEIERLLNRTKELGYEFIDMKTWKNSKTTPRANLDIEIN